MNILQTWSGRTDVRCAMFCWVVARSKRLRFARRLGNATGSTDAKSQDVGMPPQAIYTASVLNSLAGLEGELAQGLLRKVASANASRSETPEVLSSLWVQATDHLHGKVIGFMVLEPEFVAQPWQFLNDEQQDLHDFWMFTLYHSHPLLFCKISRACCGRDGVPVHAQGEQLMAHSKAWFFDVSQDSLQRLLEAFPQAASIATPFAAYVPCPHALLQLETKWKFCCYPRVLRGKQMRAWFHGRELLSAPGIPVPARASLTPAQISSRTADWMLDPQSILKLGRNVRDLINPASEDSMRSAVDAAGDHLLVLNKLREGMMMQSVLMSQTVYDIEYLVQCVLVSAELRAPTHLLSVLRQCLRLSIHEPAIRKHFESMLDQRGSVPSAPTVYRHRLTLVMGFQRVRARMLDEMLDQARASGIVRWSTIDSSPHKGYDFVLQGHATMLLGDLPEAWRCSETLVAGTTDDEAERKSREFLMPRLQLIPGIPTAVGSGRASVPHKVKAAAHSERLQANSWGQVAVLMNSTFSRTGDLGTESRMCGWKGTLDALFGDWVSRADGVTEHEPAFSFAPVSSPMPLPDNTDPVFDVQPCDPVPASTDVTPHYLLDFRPQIFIAGLLHISHNLTRDLEVVLRHWDSYVTELTHVCRLLHQPWSRQRLVRTCMQRAPWSAWVPEFEAFRGRVYTGRWGTTMDAISQLVPVLDVLRQVWDIDKFRSKAGSSNAQEGRDGEAARQLSLDVVQSALSSDLFVAYSHAMLSIASAILRMQHWTEACPCKSHSCEKVKQSCPLKTRRAPELAAGQLHRDIMSGLDIAHGALISHTSMARLTEEQKHLILADFSAARQHLNLSLRVKLSHWQQLPYTLFGIAHADSSVRQRCAEKSLQLFDAATSAALEATQHVVSVLLCAPGTAARREMECLASGKSALHDLPVLLPWAARFRFTPIAERWVEGLHASAKRHARAAPHAGPVHLAFESSLPFLQEWLSENAHHNALQVLAQHCSATKTLHACLGAVGLLQHPVTQQKIEACGGVRHLSKRARPECIEVLFHCDSGSHFQRMPDSLFLQNTRLLAPVNWALPSARHGSLQDEIWAKYALLHLKDVLKRETESAGRPSSLVIVSLASAASPVPLQTFVNPRPEPADALEDAFQFLALEDKTPEEASASDVFELTQEISFYRVAQVSPGRAVTAPGVARVSGQDALIVELLPVLRFDARSLEAVVGLEGSHEGEDRAGSLFVLNALHYPCDDLLAMQVWRCEQQLHYVLELSCEEEDPELGAAARQVIRDVMHGQAFVRTPDSKAFVLPEAQAPPNKMGEAVKTLADMGVLLRVMPSQPGVQGSHWKMTDYGLQKVQAAHRLSSPAPLFLAPAAAEIHPEANLNVLQLMLHLRKAGWDCCEKSKRSSEPEPYQALPDARKIWWIRQGQDTVNMWYLLALATAESHGLEVPHFKTQSTYKQILGLESEKLAKAKGRKAASQFVFGAIDDASVAVAPKPRAKGAKPRNRRAPKSRSQAVDGAVDDGALVGGSADPDEVDDDDGIARLFDLLDAGEADDDADTDDRRAVDDALQQLESSSSVQGPLANASSRSAVALDAVSSEGVRAANPPDSPNSSPISSLHPSEACMSASSSSSSSSSSSDSSEEVAGDEERDAAMPRRGHSHATGLLATTFFWKGCRFTMLKVENEHVGWECTCKDPKHRDVDNACRRSLRFSRHGGPDKVLRKLKWWLLQSYDYDTRKAHVSQCPWVPILGEDYLPSSEELEALSLRYVPGGDGEGAVNAAPKAKAKPAAKSKSAAKAKPAQVRRSAEPASESASGSRARPRT